MKKRIISLILITIIATPLFAQDYLPEGAKTRIGKGRAAAIDYSADGMRLAVGTTIGVWIYDTRTYEPIDLLSKNRAVIRHLAYSSDGINLVHVDISGLIYIWNTVTETEKYTLLQNRRAQIYSMALSPNGKNLVVADIFRKIRTWDIATGEEIRSFDKSNNNLDALNPEKWGQIKSLAFSPDGFWLAAGDTRNNIHLLDAITGSVKLVMKGHNRTVNSVAFSPDGNTLASASLDGNVILWNPLTGTQKATFRRNKVRAMENVVFSPDGSLLACSGLFPMNEDIFYLLDPNTATLKKTLTGHKTSLHDISFSPDLRTLASSGRDGTVRIWEVATGKNIHTIPEHFGEFHCFVWSLDGRTIIAPHATPIICVWDSKTGELQKTITPDWLFSATDMASSPDGKTLAISTSGMFAYVHHKETGQAMELKGHTNRVSCVAYSPDGKTIATGSKDRTVRLWDAQTGQLKRIFIRHKAEITSLAFSPDGKMIASGGPKTKVLLWDPGTGELIENLKGAMAATDIAFSPDGTTLASVRENPAIYLRNLQTGKQTLIRNKNMTWASCIAYSPDGNTLATGTTRGNIYIFDTNTGDLRKWYQGDGREINSIAFSPDSKTLATNSHGGVIYLWDP